MEHQPRYKDQTQTHRSKGKVNTYSKQVRPTQKHPKQAQTVGSTAQNTKPKVLSASQYNKASFT